MWNVLKVILATLKNLNYIFFILQISIFKISTKKYISIYFHSILQSTEAPCSFENRITSKKTLKLTQGAELKITSKLETLSDSSVVVFSVVFIGSGIGMVPGEGSSSISFSVTISSSFSISVK